MDEKIFLQKLKELSNKHECDEKSRELLYKFLFCLSKNSDQSPEYFLKNLDTKWWLKYWHMYINKRM
jgi:hypothetical protein